MELTGGGGDLLDVCELGSGSVVAGPRLPGVNQVLWLIEDSLPSAMHCRKEERSAGLGKRRRDRMPTDVD